MGRGQLGVGVGRGWILCGRDCNIIEVRCSIIWNSCIQTIFHLSPRLCPSTAGCSSPLSTLVISQARSSFEFGRFWTFCHCFSKSWQVCRNNLGAATWQLDGVVPLSTVGKWKNGNSCWQRVSNVSFLLNNSCFIPYEHAMLYNSVTWLDRTWLFYFICIQSDFTLMSWLYNLVAQRRASLLSPLSSQSWTLWDTILMRSLCMWPFSFLAESHHIQK